MNLQSRISEEAVSVKSWVYRLVCRGIPLRDDEVDFVLRSAARYNMVVVLRVGVRVNAGQSGPVLNVIDDGLQIRPEHKVAHGRVVVHDTVNFHFLATFILSAP